MERLRKKVKEKQGNVEKRIRKEGRMRQTKPKRMKDLEGKKEARLSENVAGLGHNVEKEKIRIKESEVRRWGQISGPTEQRGRRTGDKMEEKKGERRECWRGKTKGRGRKKRRENGERKEGGKEVKQRKEGERERGESKNRKEKRKSRKGGGRKVKHRKRGRRVEGREEKGKTRERKGGSKNRGQRNDEKRDNWREEKREKRYKGKKSVARSGVKTKQ